VVPSQAPRPTFLASGYGGQVIWVHPATELVIAVTSSVSPETQRRARALELIRGPLFAAALKRAATGTR
jgi:CubicO group peptidase (beta-lactamase class C family)